jgi:hypothetical protein
MHCQLLRLWSVEWDGYNGYKFLVMKPQEEAVAVYFDTLCRHLPGEIENRSDTFRMLLRRGVWCVDGNNPL